MTLRDELRAARRRIIVRALEDTGWNVTETARRLDVHRTYLANVIRWEGIQRPAGTSTGVFANRGNKAWQEQRA